MKAAPDCFSCGCGCGCGCGRGFGHSLFDDSRAGCGPQESSLAVRSLLLSLWGAQPPIQKQTPPGYFQTRWLSVMGGLTPQQAVGDWCEEFVCVCVCVWERERENKGKRETEWVSGRARERGERERENKEWEREREKRAGEWDKTDQWWVTPIHVFKSTPPLWVSIPVLGVSEPKKPPEYSNLRPSGTKACS